MLPGRSGMVVAFDEARGLGTVRPEGGGGADLGFHCTSIADGSRSVEVGAEVTFDVEAGPMGRWQAVRLRRVHGPAR